MATPVFFSNLFDRKRTIEGLLAESRASGDFYLLLSFSAFITTLGLLVNSGLAIVGGILVAPFLHPVLSFGMGIATSSREAILRAIRILIKSTLIVLAISFATSFLVNNRVITDQMRLASSPEFLFFLLAFSSGLIAAFSWVKQNLSASLTAVSIVVALLPPLTTAGIALSLLSRDVLAGSLLLFLINLIGIVVASTIIFSLFGFSQLQSWQERRIEQEKEQDESAERPPEAESPNQGSVYKL